MNRLDFLCHVIAYLEFDIYFFRFFSIFVGNRRLKALYTYVSMEMRNSIYSIYSNFTYHSIRIAFFFSFALTAISDVCYVDLILMRCHCMQNNQEKDKRQMFTL